MRTLGWIAVASLFLALVASAQKPPASNLAPFMNRFVLIFTQAPREFSEADVKSRAERVGRWVSQQAQEGRTLDPRILGPGGRRISSDRQESEVATTEGRLGSILFLEARDFQDAVAAARSHPGLDFGASVEIRPWAPPRLPK